MTDSSSPSYYPIDLDTRLWTEIQGFSDEFEKNWEDPEYGKLQVAVAKRIADLVLGASGTLTVETTPGWTGLGAMLTKLGIHSEVLDAVQVEVARKYATETRRMAERCLELAQMAITAEPRDQVAKFLGRVSRCYVLGLVPECIILCRAVLETAVTETFDRRDIPFPRDDKGKTTMAAKVDAAVTFKWLDSAARKDAMEVWVRGSKNIHDDPEVATDAADTITKTMRVLQLLYES